MIKTETIRTDTKSQILNAARAYDKRVREFQKLMETTTPSDLPLIFQQRIVGYGVATDPERIEAERRRALETTKNWCLKHGFTEQEAMQILHSLEKNHREVIDLAIKTGKPIKAPLFLEICLNKITEKRDIFIKDKILSLLKLAERNTKAQKVVMYKSSKRGERSLLEGYKKLRARNDVEKALEVLHTEEFEKALENLEAYQTTKK